MADERFTARVNLGAVSAWAVAKKNGFTGTEAEWETYIANASSNAASAAASAASAESSKNAAAASAAAAALAEGGIRDQNEGLFLRYDAAASLTEANRAQARSNLEIPETVAEAASVVGETASRQGDVTIYADIPGFWEVQRKFLNNFNGDSVHHTRFFPVKGYHKISGRTWMDSSGYAVAYFDAHLRLLPDISVVGQGNTRFLESEGHALTIPAAAHFASVSGWGAVDAYPITFISVEEEVPDVKITPDSETKGYYRALDGVLVTITEDEDFPCLSDFVPVAGYSKIFGRMRLSADMYAIAYFDANHALLPAVSVPGDPDGGYYQFTQGLDIPAGAVYVRVCSWNPDRAEAVLQAEKHEIDAQRIDRMEQDMYLRGVSYADFGAVMDGVFDDTDAVIACHAYANLHGCSVFQHGGTVNMASANNSHCAQIKTNVDWTGTTFLVTPEIDDARIIFSVAPEDPTAETHPVTLQDWQIAQLAKGPLNIDFLRDHYDNELLTFMTDINIGVRDESEGVDGVSYYSETVTTDRNGGLMDGPLFRAMTDAGSITMLRRSTLDQPITVKGGRIKLDAREWLLNPYFLYITRSNVTVEGLLVDAGPRRPTADGRYRGELIRADYAYHLCFRDCVAENFGSFYPWNERYSRNVSYVLSATHCSDLLIDHCAFLRGWGPMQTAWCKRVTVRNSIMGRIDNHYGCRDYLIEGCTMATSHSNINVGYGDGYLIVRDTRFIKTRDYDTFLQSRLINCREDFCAIFSGDIILENLHIDSEYPVTCLYAAMERTSDYLAEGTQILPLKLPRVRARNIYFNGFGQNAAFTLFAYGVPAGASALLYGNVEKGDMVWQGVWSNKPARLLPMLENVRRDGTETLIAVTDYNCDVTVERDGDLDPLEDLTIDRRMVRLGNPDALRLRADVDFAAIMSGIDMSWGETAVQLTQRYYDTGLWNLARVRDVVGKTLGITSAQYLEITGETF